MDDTGAGQPAARPTTEADTTDDRVHSDQPPRRARRVYIAPRHAEPFTGECPLCFVEYVSGQVVCSTCGYEPLPMDEPGQTKRQANRRTKVLEKRMQKLAEFGMYGKVNSTLLATLTGEQADLLRQEIGERGITSLESSVLLLKDCRDRYKRAKQLGYENVEDRYSCDVTFCDRVHEDGRGLNDCIFDDMFAFANLPDPPRTRTQVSAGVAANAEHANCLSKLICMSQPAGVDGFPVEYRGTWTKVWGFMFGRHIFNETEYVSYIGRKNSYRHLLTRKGIVQVPFDGTLNFLEKIYEENLPLVGGNLGRKEKQSIAAKANPPKADPQIEHKRKAEEEGNAPMGTEAASSSARAEASPGATPFLLPDPPTPKSGARQFLEPEPMMASKASSSGRPDASWSWNRDHYGARREWSFWRAAWYYRDEAGGRWISWNR